jgi:hypothetical protein
MEEKGGEGNRCFYFTKVWTSMERSSYEEQAGVDGSKKEPTPARRYINLCSSLIESYDECRTVYLGPSNFDQSSFFIHSSKVVIGHSTPIYLHTRIVSSGSCFSMVRHNRSKHTFLISAAVSKLLSAPS